MKKLLFIALPLFITLPLFILSISTPLKADALGELNKLLNTIDRLNNQNRTNNSQVQLVWKRVQARLNKLGYDAGPVDGKPGRKTQTAIAQFQQANGLTVDGKIGPQTRSVLFSNNARPFGYPRKQTADSSNSGSKIENTAANPVKTSNSASTSEEKFFNDLNSGNRFTGSVKEGRNNYDVIVEKKNNNIRITYPSYSCFGHLKYVGLQSESLKFIEKIQEGPCVNNGWVKLTPSRDGGFQFAWSRREHSRVEVAGKIRSRMVASRSEKSGAPTQYATEKTLFQQWTGETTCEDGNAIFVLENLDEKNTRLLGDLTIAPPNFVSQKPLFLTIEARKASQINEYKAISKKKSRSVFRVERPETFKLSYDAGRQEVVLKFSDYNCSDITLTPSASDTYLYKPTTAPTGRGAFFDNRGSDKQCEAYASWLDKFLEETPEYKTNGSQSSGKFFPKMVLLFADDSFVPMFGRTYDSFLPNELKQLHRDLTKACVRDPFFKKYYYLYSSLERATVAAGSSSISGLNSVSVAIAAKKIRKVRHEARIGIVGLYNTNSIEAASKNASEISTYLKENSNWLWPSERKRFEDDIDQIMTSRANDAASEVFSSLSNLPPQQKLKELSKLADGKNTFFKYLNQEQKKNIYKQAKQKQSILANELLQSDIGNLRKFEASLDGLRVFEAKSKELEKTISALNADVAKPFSNEVSSIRKSLVQSIYNQHVLELNDIPSGKEGLAESLEWQERFTAQFQAYKSLIDFEAAQKQFKNIREKLLTNAIDSFESEIASAAKDGGADAVDRVVKAYLAWSGDESLPIWIDYQFIAESYK